MSPVEYRTILKYRLMTSLFSVDKICLVCRKACLDSFEEHAVHCKDLSSFKYRHDIVRDVLYDICRRAVISAKKEAHVNFLINPSDGRSTLGPANVLVISAFMLVTIVFVPIGLASIFASSHVVEIVNRYDDRCAPSGSKVDKVRFIQSSSADKTCNTTLHVHKDMKHPIYVYY
nr:ALA-interacting subunit 5 [Tanacetum cinerariifolium]